MMKVLKSLLLLVVMLLTAGEISAQIKDPTTWKVTAIRKFGNKFEIFFNVKLAPNWHIYALDPGGDGSSIAPSFTFAPNKNIKLVGKMRETTRPTEEVMDGIDGKMRFFSGEATFVQEVEVLGTAVVKVNGKHEYQVCTDQMCLPPKTKAFSVSIKP